MQRIYKDNAERQRAYRQRKSREERNGSALQLDKTLIQIERPALRYYGGKWKIADWIIDAFPVHKCYVEPYCGGASVLLKKRPTWLEVINDLNREIITFFDCLRDRPADLIRAILLTPYAREELRRARTPAPDDPLEMARRFYVRQWQSFGSGVGRSSTGWRYQVGNGGETRANAVGSWNRTDHLWQVAERLKQVQIECDDALKVITRYDGPQTLFYVDPPYVHSERYRSSPDKGYQFEMTDQDHRRLAELLHTVLGMVIVSGYLSELYNELYQDWRRIEKTTTTNGNSVATEYLWLSPSVTTLENLPLFANTGQ